MGFSQSVSVVQMRSLNQRLKDSLLAPFHISNLRYFSELRWAQHRSCTVPCALPYAHTRTKSRSYARTRSTLTRSTLADPTHKQLLEIKAKQIPLPFRDTKVKAWLERNWVVWLSRRTCYSITVLSQTYQVNLINSQCRYLDLKRASRADSLQFLSQPRYVMSSSIKLYDLHCAFVRSLPL